MILFSDDLYHTCPKIIIYAERNCPNAKKIQIGLDLIEFEYKFYYLNEHFTLEQFKETFGEDATLPKIIRINNDAI